MTKPTVILLPGLGADHRLFELQRKAIPDLVVPAWPPFQSGDSLNSFAARLADSIPKSDNLYVGGSSFGGMVAVELAAIVRPKGIILIGSCTTSTALAGFVRGIRPLVSVVPTAAFRPRRWHMPFLAPRFGSLNDDQRNLFWEMLSATPAAFLKWGTKALLSWKPTTAAAPVHQIHGGRDLLIPLSRVKPDRIVPAGGHMLTLTNPEEVNAFLLEVVKPVPELP